MLAFVVWAMFGPEPRLTYALIAAVSVLIIYPSTLPYPTVTNLGMNLLHEVVHPADECLGLKSNTDFRSKTEIETEALP